MRLRRSGTGSAGRLPLRRQPTRSRRRCRWTPVPARSGNLHVRERIHGRRHSTLAMLFCRHGGRTARRSPRERGWVSARGSRCPPTPSCTRERCSARSLAGAQADGTAQACKPCRPTLTPQRSSSKRPLLLICVLVVGYECWRLIAFLAQLTAPGDGRLDKTSAILPQDRTPQIRHEGLGTMLLNSPRWRSPRFASIAIQMAAPASAIGRIFPAGRRDEPEPPSAPAAKQAVVVSEHDPRQDHPPTGLPRPEGTV